jgi:hypothetical protein
MFKKIYIETTESLGVYNIFEQRTFVKLGQLNLSGNEFVFIPAGYLIIEQDALAEILSSLEAANKKQSPRLSNEERYEF